MTRYTEYTNMYNIYLMKVKLSIDWIVNKQTPAYIDEMGKKGGGVVVVIAWSLDL